MLWAPTPLLIAHLTHRGRGVEGTDEWEGKRMEGRNGGSLILTPCSFLTTRTLAATKQHCEGSVGYWTQWRIQEFFGGPSHLPPPSFLPSFLPSFPSLPFPFPFLCITLIPSSPSLSHTTPLFPNCVPNPLLSPSALPFFPSPLTGVRGV
jgi:hypothetical protein